ncbi:MAG TPA: ABC transporter permease, partial [bacterium]|nr:ABC transporter permease [bacterium]
IPGVALLLRRRYRAGLVCLFFLTIPVLIILFRHQQLLAVFTSPSLELGVSAGYVILLFAVAYGMNASYLSGPASTSDDVGLSEWRLGLRRVIRNHRAKIGLFILFALYSIALLAPLIAPYDPTAQTNVLQARFLPPSLETGYLLGTDGFGRDLLSRIIYGARISLSIGFVAVMIAALIGTLLGILAGYFGGWIDTIIMRVVDLMLGFPRLFLILIVIAFVGPSIFWVIIVLGFTGWMGVARLVRGEVLSLKEREFILAAKALGVNTPRILIRHLLPNTLAPIIVFVTLTIGNVILIEAGLSFLGLGVQPPTPSWGNIIDLGRENLLDAWWISTFPGLAIVITVLSFNVVGDALRDAFDPKLRED